jgi:AraC family transcriptional regulator
MNSPVSTRQLEYYISRINKVIDYIENNIDQSLSLEVLASVAGFSKYHFHRIFGTLTGESLYRFILRLRLQKSAGLLCTDYRRSITDIALDCGFSSSAAFTRAFKEFFLMTPSQWRLERSQHKPGLQDPDSKNYQDDRNFWKDKIPLTLYNYAILTENRRINVPVNCQNVVFRDFPRTKVAYVRYIGAYKGNELLFERLFNRLCSWAGQKGLLDRPETHYLIVYHDNPEIAEEDTLRVSVCLTVDNTVEAEGEIGVMEIPPGKYVFARFEVTTKEYQNAWDWVYGEWLPSSGFLPDDRPCFEFYPTNNENQKTDETVAVDICVPIKPLA